MSSKLQEWGHLHLQGVCNYNEKKGPLLITAKWSNKGKSYLVMRDLENKRHLARMSKSLLMFLDYRYKDSSERWNIFQEAVVPTLINMIRESPAGEYSFFGGKKFIIQDRVKEPDWDSIEKELKNGHVVLSAKAQNQMAKLELYLISLRNENGGHANVLCLNHDLMTIEYFEPNGRDLPDEQSEKAVKRLLSLCKKVYPDYTELYPDDTCPKIDIRTRYSNDIGIGVQNSMSGNSEFAGTCFFWSLWFIYTRVQHPSIFPGDMLTAAFEEALQVDTATPAQADPDDLYSYGPTRLESFIVAFIRMLYTNTNLKVQFKIRNSNNIYFPSPVDVVD